MPEERLANQPASRPRMNRQLWTSWRDAEKTGLKTALRDVECRALEPGEILVEMIYVPIHGSFWLATHPDAIHPRIDEFMRDDGFVFGNGGVGRVIEVANKGDKIRPGDYVCLLGHYPCGHYDCYGCTVLHRYTECDYGESHILGHGKGANDGSFARYVILPPLSWELCYREREKPTPDQLRAFMFGFLLADVRNALTRHPDSLRMRRMLLIGAGHSGHVAAYIHLHSCPEAKIFVVEANRDRAESLASLAPDAVRTCILPEDIARGLEVSGRHDPHFQQRLGTVIADIAEKQRAFFGGRGCNLLFDASSGNTSQIWDNRRILSPATHCIAFGFGSHDITLKNDLIQLSGLTVMMTRGVGNLRNRREVIELIKAGASSFVEKSLIQTARELVSLEECEAFVREQHHNRTPFHQLEHTYVSLARAPAEESA